MQNDQRHFEPNKSDISNSRVIRRGPTYIAKTKDSYSILMNNYIPVVGALRINKHSYFEKITFLRQPIYTILSFSCNMNLYNLIA
jgi:hypothetical protein